MQVKSLKVFCDVVGKRSFSRAADENGISQSGASQMVHHLEEHLGVKLIDRSKRPFVLTPEGEVYYNGCRQVVQRLHALEENVRMMRQQVAGRVSIACIYSVGLGHINEVIQTFLAEHSSSNVRVEYHHPDRVYELVESEQVDFGIVSYPKQKRDIQVTAWREEPMGLVCAPQHSLASKESVSWEDLDGLRMVCFDDNLLIRRQIDRALVVAGSHVEVAMEFDNIETIKRAIEIDLGVSVLPMFTVRNEVESNRLAAIPMDDDFRRPVGIIRRRGKELGQTALRFMQALLEQANQPINGECSEI